VEVQAQQSDERTFDFASFFKAAVIRKSDRYRLASDGWPDIKAIGKHTTKAKEES
jgi:hypothetical protein